MGSTLMISDGVHVLVASHSIWLEEAMCRWLHAPGLSLVRYHTPTRPSNPTSGVLLIIDDGAQRRGEMAVERPWPACPRVYLATALTPRCLLEALLLDAISILSYDELEER